MAAKPKRTGLRTFYTLVTTQALSLIGSQISGLAIGIWVYNQTGDASPLALVAFFGALPVMLATSISGVLADRWDRRYVMAIADAGQAIGTVLLLLSFLSGSFELWHLYAVSLWQAIFKVFQGPAFAASITMLVPDDHRDRANAIQQLSGPAAGIIAPTVAGLVFALVGVTGAIVIDLVTFAAAFIVVLNVHIPHPEQTEEGKAMAGSVWKEALSGLRYLWVRRGLFILTVQIALLNFVVAGTAVLATPYLLARTGSEATLGILLSVMNGSALVGGIVMGIWGGTRPRIHTVMPGIIILGFGLTLVGMAQMPLTLGLAMALFLFPFAIVNASLSSLLQTKVAPDVQGRVFAVIDQIALLLTPLSYLLVGFLADNVFEPAVGQAGWEPFAGIFGNSVGAGMGLLLAIEGILAIIIAVFFYAMPIVRQVEAKLPDYAPPAQDDTSETLETDALAV